MIQTKYGSRLDETKHPHSCIEKGVGTSSRQSIKLMSTHVKIECSCDETASEKETSTSSTCGESFSIETRVLFYLGDKTLKGCIDRVMKSSQHTTVGRETEDRDIPWMVYHPQVI